MLSLATHCHAHYHCQPFHFVLFKFTILVARQHPNYIIQCYILYCTVDWEIFVLKIVSHLMVLQCILMLFLYIMQCMVVGQNGPWQSVKGSVTMALRKRLAHAPILLPSTRPGTVVGRPGKWSNVFLLAVKVTSHRWATSKTMIGTIQSSPFLSFPFSLSSHSYSLQLLWLVLLVRLSSDMWDWDSAPDTLSSVSLACWVIVRTGGSEDMYKNRVLLWWAAIVS